MPYFNRDPKRDHNFDNHPFVHVGFGDWGFGVGEFLDRYARRGGLRIGPKN